VPLSPKFRDWLSRLRAYLILNNLVYLYTIVLGTIALIASLFDRSGRIQHRIARFWSWLILKTVMSPLTVTGVERLPDLRPRVYAVNHLSALDIPVLFEGFPFQFRIIAKHELFRYPFLGWYLQRSGQIPVNRESALSSMRSVTRAVETLRAGMPLVVFPEGGRSYDGRVQPFLGGAFYAAIKAQVEIVPVAISGTFEALPINSFHMRPRPLRLSFGDPIPTTGYSRAQMDALAARVQQAVEELYYGSPAPSGTPLGSFALESNETRLTTK